MAKVAIIGDSTSVAGFRPLGFAVFPVREPDAARALWGELVSGEYGTVFMTEPVHEALEDLIAEVVDRPLPAVTVIPGAGSAGGVGEAKLARAIERALGTTMPLTEEEG
jgi:V/A-type H+-transporting ATPase subunit F